MNDEAYFVLLCRSLNEQEACLHESNFSAARHRPTLSLDCVDAMRRFMPLLLSLIGLLLLLLAAWKGSGAALPYQDPTPQLLLIQHSQLHTAKLIASGGGILFAVGIAWVFCRWIENRKS